MKWFLHFSKCFFLVLVVLILTSCSVTSDPDTEKKIIGTWELIQESEEDGVTMTSSSTETYRGDGTYEVLLQFKITEPICQNMGEIKYSGTWRASKSRLICEIDKNSIEFFLSNSLSSAEKMEFKDDMLTELENAGYIEGGEIICITNSELIIRDEIDGSRIVYSRVENDVIDKRNDVGKDSKKGSHKLKLKAYNGMSAPLAPQGNNTYDAKNLVDGNLSTGWAIDLNSEEYDVVWGPNLQINENKTIDYIVIHNGYAKNADSFRNNSRPARITIYRPIAPDTGDPEDEDILYSGPLSDTSSPQRLGLNPKFNQSAPVTNICIKLYNEPRTGYYLGKKWPKDLVISEIEFWGH